VRSAFQLGIVEVVGVTAAATVFSLSAGKVGVSFVLFFFRLTEQYI
jgi:hypothetical protein